MVPRDASLGSETYNLRIIVSVESPGKEHNDSYLVRLPPLLETEKVTHLVFLSISCHLELKDFFELLYLIQFLVTYLLFS